MDGVRPELTGARLNGRRLTLTFSELLARRPAPAAGGFEVRVDGTARSVRGVAVSGASVVLTLDSPATLARTVTVDYTGAGAPVLDPARNPAAAFAREPVRNVVNIVFILADDHATQAVSAYGSKLISTPNIDRLAAEGVVFDRALAPNSICKPARATLLTGKYAHRHGQLTNFDNFDGDQPQIQKMLGRAGYATALLGKWHLSSDPQGFDHWEALSDFGGQGSYYSPGFRVRGGTYRRRRGYATDIITDRAIAWMEEKRSDERPFLALVWHKASHRPWDPGLQDFRRFEDVVYPVPATFRDAYAGRATALGQQTMRVDSHLDDRDFKITPPEGDAEAVAQWKLQTYLRDYLRVVYRLDANVGRLLEYLDDAGLADSTLVVYASDQGFFLGEHGWFDKRWFHEESLRLPLVVRAPGAAGTGTRVSNIVSQTDVAPTLLDVAGLEASAGMQGASLVPFLKGSEPANWRTSFYYHYVECPGIHRVARHRAVVTERYKLVDYYQSGEWELFDRENDPTEVNNLYGESAYDGRVSALKAELERLRQALGDTEAVEGEERVPRFAEGGSSGREIVENARDLDIGAPLKTSVYGWTYRYRLEGPDASQFTVVACNGQLRTKPGVSYDHEQKDTYSVVVRVEDSRGRTDTIDVTVSVRDTLEAPDKPSAPVVAGRTSTSLALEWVAPGNRGPPISDYDYRYRVAASGQAFTEVVDTPIAATETTIPGLKPATGYEIQIRAENEEGAGEWSESVTGETAG